MVKAYLRYEHAAAWGVVASAGGCAFDATGRLLATACLERVGVWSLKQGAQVKALFPAAGSGSTAVPPQVTVLERSPTGSSLAAGYSDGSIRLWNLSSGECVVSLHGHKSAVSALRFNRSGGLLASGGRDTDCIVWDIVAEAGLFRLKGHRDEVTGVVFCDTKGAAPRLVTSSKDSHLRVWDLTTQHCVQTVVGHRCEVWSLDVDPTGQRLVTGAADAHLRIFRISHPGDDDDADDAPGEAPCLVPCGAPLVRPGPDRAAAVRFAPDGTMLAVMSAGRLLELWNVHSEEEARRRAKRRRKRKRDKGDKAAAGAADAEPPAAEGDLEVVASDEMTLRCTVPLKHKALALAWCPKPPPGVAASFAVTLATNSVEVYDLPAAAPDGHTLDAPAEPQRVGDVSLPGHRADVRAVALSSDDSMLVSTSHAGAKIWNPRTGVCLRTVPCGYGLCCVFAPGARYALVGTKTGSVDFVDVAAAQLSRSVAAHAGAVWSIALQPNGEGFVTGGSDKEVKFWAFCMEAPPAEADAEGEGGEPGAAASALKTLSARHTRTLRLTDDVLCCRFSPDGKYLAVALLDATVKVFLADSLKFFVSLFGHKLPVLCCDVSSDGTLIATGSADKNVKLWGLDFGDCHASLRAHDDSVTCLAFVPRTHYLFTCSKDRTLKYWDADKREQLLSLFGHAGELWGLAVASDGGFVVTAGHDRSLRLWTRTEEAFFVDEEREKRLESLFEAGLEDAPERGAGGDGAKNDDQAPGEGATALAGRRSMATVGATEGLVDAIEMATAEVARLEEHHAEQEQARAGGNKAPIAFVPNPLLLGMSPKDFVLRSLGAVRTADLEQVLLLLPFASALQLLGYLPDWLATGATSGELVVNTAVLLVRLHNTQLAGTPGSRGVLLRLRQQLRASVQHLKDAMGLNLAACDLIHRFHYVDGGATDE